MYPKVLQWSWCTLLNFKGRIKVKKKEKKKNEGGLQGTQQKKGFLTELCS